MEKIKLSKNTIKCPGCGLNVDTTRVNKAHFPYTDCEPPKAPTGKGSSVHSVKIHKSVRILPSKLKIIEQQWGSLQRWLNEQVKHLGG